MRWLVGQGPVALNWLVFPEPSGSFAKAASDCSAASHGAYKININFLSNASDQQRQTLVQRLAAGDSSIDILAMDVDWTAEFASARAGSGRGPAPTRPRSPRACCPGPLKTATWQRQAVGRADQLQHRAALVPQGPGQDPTQDLEPDDR